MKKSIYIKVALIEFFIVVILGIACYIKSIFESGDFVDLIAPVTVLSVVITLYFLIKRGQDQNANANVEPNVDGAISEEENNSREGFSFQENEK